MKSRKQRPRPLLAKQGRSRLIQRMLEQALRCHRGGQLAEAERIYRQILTIDADNADSLHLLGMITVRSGDYEAGIELILRAIAINPKAPIYHSNLGTILHAQGKLDEAGARFQHALDLKADFAEAHTNLGNVFKAQGKAIEAVACQKRALALNPNNAEACSNLGNALQAQGNLDEAMTCYERALALKPDYAEAHINLGVALVAQDRIAEGIAHYERALQLNPNSANAHNNLGVALTRQGRILEGMTCYQRALVLDPEHVDALNNLGISLHDQGKSDEAIAHYKRVLAIKPGHADALNNLGIIFEELGKFEEAMGHYERAIALRPDFAEAYWNRAGIKSYHSSDAELAVLETLAARIDLSANKASYIHFALAKAFEDTEDYVRAFEHLRRGNSLKRGLVHYDEAAVFNFFKRISDVFERGLFDRFQGAGDPSSVPVFVLGMPRSGSSLVEQILACHPQIHGAGELTDLAIVTDRVLKADGQRVEYPEFIRGIDDITLRRLSQAYLARLPVVAEGVLRIIDKLPGNFFRVGLIRLMLPNARIIHAVRDPVDTCVSCYSKLFKSGFEFSYDLAELGRYYGCYRELMAHWHSVLPPGAILDVSYEDVVDDLEGEARRLIDYCGLPWDDRCIAFHKASRSVKTASAVQVRRPLYRSSLQRWRKYETGIAPLLLALGKVNSRILR